MVDLASFEGLKDFLLEGLPGFVQFFESGSPELADDFADFHSKSLIDLSEGGPAAHHQVPDGHGQFAGYGADRQTA